MLSTDDQVANSRTNWQIMDIFSLSSAFGNKGKLRPAHEHSTILYITVTLVVGMCIILYIVINNYYN